MKKSLHFLVIILAIFYSSIGNSQIIPSYTLCDEDMDGIVFFDLTTKIPEALGSLNPDDHIVTFHHTYNDAFSNTNIIENPTSYPSSYHVQSVGIRIENIIDNTVEIKLLDIRKAPMPVINQPINLSSFDGYFDLTENTPIITEGNTLYTVYYFPTEQDADSNTNQIENPNNFFASNSTQTIWTRIDHLPNGGVVCSVKTSFTIHTVDISQISDYEICDQNDDGFGVFDLYSKASEIVNSFESYLDYIITFHETANDAQLGINSITSSMYINLTPSVQTLYVRIEDMSGNFETGSFDLVVHSFPVGTPEDLYSSDGVFDFTENNLIINPTENPDYNISYHLTEQEAQNGTGALTNTTSYTIPVGISQSIWVRIYSETGCYIIIRFHLITEHSTITGNLSFDINNDGICDENDNSQSFIKIKVNNQSEEQDYVFTNDSGNFIFYNTEEQVTYTLTPELENPALFNVIPAQFTFNFPLTEGNEGIANFCVMPNGTHPDVKVVISPIDIARPGFEASYKIIYKNIGNQTVSGNIDFEFDSTRLDFVSSNPTAGNQSVGLLSYIFTDLNPFEQRTITIKLDVNSPQEDPAVNIGDILPFSAEITINQNDINPDDNIYEFNQEVVGAYDPNDITCIEGEVVHPDYIGKELHYRVRFENTGNFYAENVVVVVEIDTEKYNINSLQILNTSHSSTARISDNTLEVFFNQIYLYPEAQGDILFVMNSKETLSEGDSVQSKADIYFDYNYPIITNDAVTSFQATMSIEENIKDIDVKFYPNPTTDYFNITSEVMIQSIELYDVSGRLVKRSLVNGFETQQNVSNLTNGVYILKIKTKKGEVTGKIIKK